MSNKNGEKGLVLTGDYLSADLVSRPICGARKHGVHAQVRGGHSTILMQPPIPPKKYFYFFRFVYPLRFLVLESPESPKVSQSLVKYPTTFSSHSPQRLFAFLYPPFFPPSFPSVTLDDPRHVTCPSPATHTTFHCFLYNIIGPAPVHSPDHTSRTTPQLSPPFSTILPLPTRYTIFCDRICAFRPH